MRKASQLKVKEKTATIACPAHDRCADRMRRCLTQFRFLMGCQRPLPLPKKKEQNSQKRLLHRSFHLPIERTIDRTIAGAFDRLINSSLLCAIFGLLVLILSLDFHAQLMFMTSDCVAAITQLDPQSSCSCTACLRMLHILRKLPTRESRESRDSHRVCDLNLCLASCLTCENQILIDVMTAATESHSKSFPKSR